MTHWIHMCMCCMRPEVLCPGPLQGIPARQHDAWNIGMTTSDDFTMAEVSFLSGSAASRMTHRPLNCKDGPSISLHMPLQQHAVGIVRT